MDSPEKAPLLGATPLRSEFNAVAATSVAVAAVAFEALGLLPPELLSDAPASLRCSSFVLIALCAGPVVGAHRTRKIAGDRIHVGELSPELEQRLVAVCLLAVVAIVGERHADAPIRAADAIFCLLAGWGGLALFALRSTRVVPGSALFGSSLFYAGVRVVLQAVSHSSEVVNFRVSREDVSARGYALSDCVGSTALAFGGSCCACCGLCVLANDRRIESFGTRVISPAVSQIGAMAFAAALVAQLSVYSSLEALPALFSDSSCAGDHCGAARRARRFFISNSHVGCLWACVVAMVVFGLPRTNKEPANRESLASAYYSANGAPQGAAILSSFVSASVVAAFVHFADEARLAPVGVWCHLTPARLQQDGSFAIAEVTLLYMSIPVTWFVSSLVGCVLFVLGNGMYIQSRLGSVFGFDLRYFTHWSLATSTLITGLLLVTTLISWFGYTAWVPWKPARQRFSHVETATAGLAVALVSVQLALTLLTLSLFAAFDGSIVSTEGSFREQGGRRACSAAAPRLHPRPPPTGYEFTLQHSVSFFFAAALYGTRFEVARKDGGGEDRERLSTRARRACYYAPPPALGVAWLASLATTWSPSPYDHGTSWHLVRASLPERDACFCLLPVARAKAVGVVAALVPWLVVGMGV